MKKFYMICLIKKNLYFHFEKKRNREVNFQNCRWIIMIKSREKQEIVTFQQLQILYQVIKNSQLKTSFLLAINRTILIAFASNYIMMVSRRQFQQILKQCLRKKIQKYLGQKVGFSMEKEKFGQIISKKHLQKC